jgi:hypothetical protein
MRKLTIQLLLGLMLLVASAFVHDHQPAASRYGVMHKIGELDRPLILFLRSSGHLPRDEHQ